MKRGVAGLILCACVALLERADARVQAPDLYGWQTIATGPMPGSADGAGQQVRFNAPNGVAVGPDGTIYVADTLNHTIRKIAAGVTTTLAGAPGGSGAVDGIGSVARFNQPVGLVVDAASNVYVADRRNHTIRKVTPDGVVSTVAGHAGAPGALNGPSAVARFNAPSGLTLGPDGTIYVADTNNHQIRKIAPGGLVATLAGSTQGTNDGTGTGARFSLPWGIDFAPDGTLVVGDSDGDGQNAAIRRVTTTGIVTTIIRHVVMGTSYPFIGLRDLAVDGAGNVLVADAGHATIVSVSPAGVPTLFAGLFHQHGSNDGDVASATFSAPMGIAFDQMGRILVADAGSHTIRQLASGVVSTIAGGVQFLSLSGIVPDDTGGFYLADWSAVRYLSATNVVGTIAGHPWEDGNTNGAFSAARFSGLRSIARGSDGSLYVGDESSHSIRKLSFATGSVSTLAGVPGSYPTFCGDNLNAQQLGAPRALAVSPAGVLWVVDSSCSNIRTVAPNGTMTIVAGGFGSGGSADGVGTAASFQYPKGIAIDQGGVVYIADTSNNTIRRIAPDFTVTTFAGVPSPFTGGSFADGIGSSARFSNPTGLALDADGNLFVADTGNCIIRRITPAAEVTTVSGHPGACALVDNVGDAARFAEPRALTVGYSVSLELIDNGTAIRRGILGLGVGPTITQQPNAQTVPSGDPATFSIAVNAAPDPQYQWQISSNGFHWQPLTDMGPYSGTTTPTLTITAATVQLSGTMYRCVATNAGGSAASGGALLTVTAFTLHPDALFFAAIKEGAAGAVTSVTAPQNITVRFGAVPPVSWSATSDEPWLEIANGAGIGSGLFKVTIVNPGNIIGGATRLDGTITVSVSGYPPVALPIALNISALGFGMLPFGQIDAPISGTDGVTGAIGVSGWALDDIGVKRVAIYRNCLPAEPQAFCVSGQEYGLFSSVVYLGDAAILEDARPDVAAAFPTVPAANRAGWGLQVLTNNLPRTEGPYSPYGGEGPMTFYAIAFDEEGLWRVLGYHAWNQGGGATTVTLRNDTIARPFGTIDTPSQGELVTTPTLANFGWALTPDSNAGYLIPTDGSTMFVFVDGVPIGSPIYNQCRGNVGNPVPDDLYCDDDVSNIFGNASPQLPFTPRTSNPSRFRNLDAGRGAIGSFTLDLSSYDAGLHTIAWSVTDSGGRIEGLGSRFFRTLPSGARPASSRASSKASPQVSLATGAKWLADSVSERRNGRVLVRTGFDLNQRYTAVPPLTAERAVTIPQMGRVEAHLGAGATVTMPLPIGARLDRDTGVFTWVPPVGYLGTFSLTFDRSGTPFVIRITIAGN